MKNIQNNKKRISEQVSLGQYQAEVQILKLALERGCIKEYTWFTPDTTPIRYTTSGRPLIYGKNVKTGQYYRFYADMKIYKDGTNQFKTWECDFVPKTPITPTVTPTVTVQTLATKPLDQNQKDLLVMLEKDGWYVMEPAPSDFKIAQGDYEKADLTKAIDEKNPGYKYKSTRYFPEEAFKGGFFVYKKTVGQEPPKVTKGAKVEYSSESCRIAINGLWNNLDKPRRFPLDDATRAKYEEVARGCAEKEMLINFTLKKRLKDLNL